MEFKQHLSKYLELAEEIKELQEEQQLHKEALTLAMQEKGVKKLYEEDLGQVTLVEPKPRKTFVVASAKKLLTKEQIAECTTEKESTPFVKIQSMDALKASKSFMEKQAEKEMKENE